MPAFRSRHSAPVRNTSGVRHTMARRIRGRAYPKTEGAGAMRSPQGSFMDRFSGYSRGCVLAAQRRSTEILSDDVQVGILAKRFMHFFSTFLGIHEHAALAEMPSLGGSLGAAENTIKPRHSHTARLSKQLKPICRLRPQTYADDFVIESKKLAETAWVALPSTSSIELPVNPGRFMQFGANHMQSSHLGAAGPPLDVGAAASH